MKFLQLKRKGEKSKPEPEASFPVLDKTNLGISPAAQEFIKQQTAHPYLRVGIKGGGCSGLSLIYEWCDSLRLDDQVFSQNNAQVCIDKKSLSILGGSTLHVRKNLSTSEFILVNNPVAKQCSCGQSFAL